MESAKYRRVLLLSLAALLILGTAVTRQYGESWDEQQFFKYADSALEAYRSWWQSGTVPLTGNTYDDYGPPYVMVVALGAHALGWAVPWITSDLRHLLYFVTFLLGLWALYDLCSRWLDPLAALGSTALFAFQPLLWGQAFISPKDVPFTALFLLSLATGLRLIDGGTAPSLAEIQPGRARRMVAVTLAWLVAVLALLIATPLVQAQISSLVTAAAAGHDNIVAKIASDIHKVDPAVYTRRYFVFYVRATIGLIGLSTVGIILMWRKSSSALRFVARTLPAAVLLGITTAVRLFGPLAGALVAGYALWKTGRKAVPTLIVYFVLAAAVVFFTWPYLWPDPIGHLAESAAVMSRYPWKGTVLFNGAGYPSTELPTAYLPVLLGIQLTEPVWPLFVFGAALALYAATQGDTPARILLIAAGVWFVLPLIGLVASRAPLYDNFRQVLFILPPVFMMAGYAFSKINSPVARATLIGLCVLPGIVAGIRLHPYEYVYYNQFIGGEAGAFRRFEMDYWGISYREAAQYLDRTAQPGDSVWVEGPTHLLQVYIRPDLKIYSSYEPERAEHYDYVVALTRYDLDLRSYPDAPVIHAIQREGALLTVIKKP
jgi:hypothetical protein